MGTSCFGYKKYLTLLINNKCIFNTRSVISGGECFICQGYVNPLGLPVRSGIQEMPLDSFSTENIVLNNYMMPKSTTGMIKNSSSGYYQNRVRRDQNYGVVVETYVNDDGKHIEVIKMVSNIAFYTLFVLI